jgi:hypothetical protein
MTRYEAILALCCFLLAAFAGYFIYREWTDPILIPGKAKAPADVEAVQSGPAALEAAPQVDPEELRQRVEEEMTGQFSQLATLMESRLSTHVGALQDQAEDQAGKLESASELVNAALDGYQAQTRDSLAGLSDSLGLIDTMRSEAGTINSSLDDARQVWAQMFDDIAAIGETKDNRLDEENFDFQTYEVQRAETLSEIAKALEASYNLPASDLGFLLNQFNEIEYRYYDPGGRRAPYRVVANDTLRVPVPRTAGEIIDDYALPDKLREQVASINQASSANASLRSNLTRQVDTLKRIEAHIRAVDAVSASLAQMDLQAEGPLQENPDLSPALQDAWRAFETAATAYQSASGSEEEKIARENLQRAITALLEQHEKDYLQTTQADEDPVNFYLRFIQKYRPATVEGEVNGE